MKMTGRPCWCGNVALEAYGASWRSCRACGTLVRQEFPDGDVTRVTDEDADMYGKNYYQKRLVEKYGLPELTERLRGDLPERCLHWLRTLLRYRRPPARVLEIGSAHGGFVALLRWAGFEATGLEISPWLVDLARSTFQVPMLTGPLEDQELAPASLDAVALMDVLEHLPDPLATMGRCLELLRPDGFLLVQTPCFPFGTGHEQLVSTGSPFLSHLQTEEHLFLFSRESVRRFFEGLGALDIRFEEPIFSHYDMFLAVGRRRLEPLEQEQAGRALTASPSARLVQALIDKDDEKKELERRLVVCEADRTARLEVIERQGRECARLEGLCRQDSGLGGARGPESR